MNKFNPSLIPVHPFLRILSRLDQMINIKPQLENMGRIFHENLHPASAAEAAVFLHPGVKRHHLSHLLHPKRKVRELPGKGQATFLRQKLLRNPADTDIFAPAQLMEPQRRVKAADHFLIVVLCGYAFQP